MGRVQLKHSVLLFKGAAIVSTLVIGIASWFLYTEIVHGIKQDRAFNNLEYTINQLVTHKERFIVERQRYLVQGIEPLFIQFKTEFERLLPYFVDDSTHIEQLFKIDEQVQFFRSKFTEFAQSQARLGFEETEGVYGEFRFHAHGLQLIASKEPIKDLEILVLELRRAEKDYLLRLKPYYLTLHQQYLDKITYLIKTILPDKSSVYLKYLAQYNHGFTEYISILQHQGLTHKTGLRAELSQIIVQIDLHYKVLRESLYNSQQKSKTALILYTLSAIVMISIGCLLLLNHLNNRVSSHILKINAVLRRVTKEEDFSLRTGIFGHDEIAQIGHDLDALFSFIELLLARLSAVQLRLIEEAKIASLGNMVSGFAHELNTPIGVAITSQSHLKEQLKAIKSDLESGQLKKNALSKLVNEAESALYLLENNLSRTASLIDDFKKVAVHQQYDDVNEFNLKTLAMGVFDCYQSELKMMHCHVDFEIPDNLVLESYPAALSQIFSYCISNSMKHGKIKDKTLNIVVSAMVVNDFVHIYFKDDGYGIDKELLPIIFEPFITTKRHDGGTGLGLNIVYNLVTQKLKGEVKMQSPAHGGACLHIILEKARYYFIDTH